MKDYYRILGVTPSASDEEIRKCYRQLAMEFHPDRNPDNPEAEERFKEIAEAYGVFADPVKRRRYDAARHAGAGHGSGQANAGFAYSQDDILRDLFQDPRFQQMFQGLLNEFQRSGFRANPLFLKRIFFGNRGGFLVGGLFFFGSMAAPVLSRTRLGNEGNRGLLSHVGRAVGSLLGRSSESTQPVASLADLDITYHIPVSAEDLRHGKWVQVAVASDSQEQELLKIKIPAGSTSAQRLRVRGKGRKDDLGRRGDLYLQLKGV